MSKQRATDTKLGGLHEMLGELYTDELKLMVKDGEYDIQMLKMIQDFLKQNNITSNIEDSPQLGELHTNIISLDESALPKGHDFKLVQEG